MTEPFRGFDSTHAYHRPNSKGETGKLQVRAPLDVHRNLAIIKEARRWPFETLTDVMLDCLHIGIQVRLELLDQQTPIGEMMKMRATVDAMEVERRVIADSSQELTSAWSLARSDAERAQVMDAAQRALPFFSADVRERLTRMLGL